MFEWHRFFYGSQWMVVLWGTCTTCICSCSEAAQIQAPAPVWSQIIPLLLLCLGGTTIFRMNFFSLCLWFLLVCCFLGCALGARPRTSPSASTPRSPTPHCSGSSCYVLVPARATDVAGVGFWWGVSIFRFLSLLSSSVVYARKDIVGFWVAIVRACYTMENGPNDKNGKKMGKSWKICPDRKWGKNGRKIPKKWKIGPIFHFFGIFRPFFPHFRSGQIFHGFPIFFPFLSFGPFSIV